MFSDERHYRIEWKTDNIPVHLGFRFIFQERIGFCLPHLLIPFLLEKLTGSQLVKKFPVFY
jgi:hypothetical protein